jgi:hypothetical protein
LASTPTPVRVADLIEREDEFTAGVQRQTARRVGSGHHLAQTLNVTFATDRENRDGVVQPVCGTEIPPDPGDLKFGRQVAASKA